MTLESANENINSKVSKLEKSLENYKSLSMLLNCDEVKAILPKLQIYIQSTGCILEVWKRYKSDFYFNSFGLSALIVFDDKGIHVRLHKDGFLLKTVHPFTVYDCIKYLKAIADEEDVELI